MPWRDVRRVTHCDDAALIGRMFGLAFAPQVGLSGIFDVFQASTSRFGMRSPFRLLIM